MSDVLHLLPLLRIPLQAIVDVPGSWSSARISSDNILHDLTIPYQGVKYNVLMEDVASIINIPQTLRNIKVFNHQGTKHFRVVKHRGRTRGKEGKKSKKQIPKHTSKDDGTKKKGIKEKMPKKRIRMKRPPLPNVKQPIKNSNLRKRRISV